MRNRNIFWPAILILIGVIALLINTGAVSADRLYRLGDLWPLVLIVIGLEILARRAVHGPMADLAAVLIILVAAGGAVAYVAVGPAVPGGTRTLDVKDTVGTLTQANLHVDAGAENMTVEGTASLGADLYRAHIEYSGSKPDVTLDRSTGDLAISQNNALGFFGGRHLRINIQVNSGVPWSFSVNSGAATDTFNIGSLKVTSMDLNSAATREDITLGTPTGIVPININGAALTVHLHRPGTTDASVHVSGPAVSLVADGQQYHGFGDLSWQSGGYGGAGDAYQVEVSGAACTVTMDKGSQQG
jgi:cell wall-active antibiotic response 4TMS protein YvqF